MQSDGTTMMKEKSVHNRDHDDDGGDRGGCDGGQKGLLLGWSWPGMAWHASRHDVV